MMHAVVTSIVSPHGSDRPDTVQTYLEVAETVLRVQAALKERGFRCPTNSALGSLFNKAQLLNKQWEAHTDGLDLLTLMQAEDAVRIAHAVEAVLDVPEAKEAIRRITRSDMYLSMRQPSQGKDSLWELDLHRFLQVRGLPVRVQEPDLVLTFPKNYGEYGMACKKVYSEASFEKQLQKGCRQLRASNLSGVVAVNLDDVTPQLSILVQPSRVAANNVLQGFNIAFIERHRQKLQEAVMSGGCDGVLFATAVQADIQGMSPRFNRVTEFTLWTVEGAGNARHFRISMLRGLIDGLSQGVFK